MAISRANMNKEVQNAPSSPKANKKISTVMGEFGRGKLKSGSGDTVTDRDQAVAIALSEARDVMNRKYGGKGITIYKDSVNRRFGKGGVSMPKKTAKEEMMERMMEDPRNPGAFMRNAAKELKNVPEYTEKERRLMKEAKEREMDRKMQQARRRFYSK